MTRHELRRAECALALCAAVLMILAGCATEPGTATVAPSPTPPPPTPTPVVVEAPPDGLVLTRADLPAGFQLAAEKREGPEYMALYLRPNALEDGASGGNRLLSVLTVAGVYTTTAEAEQVYREASTDRIAPEMEEATMLSKGATDVVVEPFDSAMHDVDASEAYRVTYRLMEHSVFEYGHRFRLGNVLGYVIVTAIGDPDEPERLLEDARALAQRQVDRVAGAARDAPPQ